MKRFSAFKNIFFLIRNIDSKTFIVLNTLNVCLNGFKNSVLIVLFVNKFLGMVEAKESIFSILELIGIVVAIYIPIILFSLYFENYYRPSVSPKIQKTLTKKLYDHAISSDLRNFDDTEFYDEYIFAMQNIGSMMFNLLDDFAQMISNILITVFISGIFISINMLIMGAVILSVGMTVFLYFFIIKINYQKDIASLPYRRKSDYYKRVFYLKDYAKDLRMTEISKMLIDMFDENIKALLEIYRKYGFKLMLVNTLNGLTISLLLDIGLMILLSYQLIVSHTITLGEFTAASYGIWSLFSSLNGLMFGFNRFPEYSLRIQKMIDFFNRKPEVYTSGNNDIQYKKGFQLRLQNIDFKYTIDGKKVLDNVSLTIRQGEKIAIVGENGSGKSTLIKIILGLYQPNCGEIFLNDQNVKSLDIQKYRRLFASVFQDYVLFSSSIAENVALDMNYNSDQIITALQKSLFYEDESLKGIPIEATLTKEFDDKGIVLSGGQSQKLIISRAFLNREFSVMDEPSSSLDVISEAMLNDVIINDVSDKGIIIISHRLSTAKRADRIIVISQGKIIEEGTHEELIQKEGEYAKMFKIQAEKYSFN